MATQPRIPIRAVRNLSGYSIPCEAFPEAATQTWKKGALVFLTAGFLQECPTNPPLIMGVARADAGNGTNAGDKTQIVDLAHPDTLFVGNMDTSASEGTGTTANTDRGKMYGVTRSSATNNPWYPDKNKGPGANARVVIWGFWLNAQDAANQAVGDTLGWVVFSFDPAYYQGLKTS